MISEAFDCGPWAYNVDQARQILAAAPREPIEVGCLVGLGAAVVIGMAQVDPVHCMTVDIDEPIIMVPTPDEVDLLGEPNMPIDGWHRVMRALCEHRQEDLRAYLLTDEEARSIRFLIPGLHEIPNRLAEQP